MRGRRNNEGATLVELMLGIAIGTLIVGAALTVLLLGVRVNFFATDTVGRQQTAQVVLSLLQDLATEGAITKLDTYEGSKDWKISGWDGINERVFLSYSQEEGTIYTGDGAEKQAMLEGLNSSDISLDGQLVNFSIENKEGTFASSVYCRAVKVRHSVHKENGEVWEDEIQETTPKQEESDEQGKLSEEELAQRREAFLRALISQKGSNGGIILKGKGYDTGNFQFFSQWYIGGYNAETREKGWDEDTPWCGCFIAWGLSYVTEYVATPYFGTANERDKWFANVDEFMEYFQNNPNQVKWLPLEDKIIIPKPGDLVFFDFTNSGSNNPSHMGAVLKVTNKYIYTIEGNTGDMVDIKQYALDDQSILGYGVLNWEAKSTGG